MNKNREITGKDAIYFLLLSVILTFCVVIANKVETNAQMPEITTEATTVVQETTTEEVETTTDVPLTTVKFEDIPELTELGTFLCSAYCNERYAHICNDGTPDDTATGTKPTAGRTVAVDPSVIPYGTKLYINGNYYIAEDCGPDIKGNRIDICFASHEEANNFGRQYAKVFQVGC